MILLDTHVWIWWVHRDAMLPRDLMELLQMQEPMRLAVSAISLWEVAKLVERKRLELPVETTAWMEMALGGSGVSLIELSPAIAIASTSLPQPFHRDPADQIIVATSRVRGLPLATCDARIRSYPHVRILTGAQLHE